jgi:hypothetical protein
MTLPHDQLKVSAFALTRPPPVITINHQTWHFIDLTESGEALYSLREGRENETNPPDFPNRDLP